MPDFKTYPLLMEPHFTARPWGGRALASALGKPLPEGGPFGEAWELSDHPDGRSKVANGVYAGRLFGELLREYPREMLGLATAPERYPLLVKYIDAADDLSLQVHPSDANAPAGDRGKSECWHVLRAEPGAAVIWGLRPGVDAPLLRGATDAGERAVEQCIQRYPVSAGDFIYIPAGTMHAILRGVLLCEIQQSSNTTYRVWDWERQPPRTLHIEEACRVGNFDPAAQKTKFIKTESLAERTWHELTHNEFFTVQFSFWPAATRQEMTLCNPHGLILNVSSGQGALRAEQEKLALAPGQTWFLPAGMEHFEIAGPPDGADGTPLRLLLTESRELT